MGGMSKKYLLHERGYKFFKSINTHFGVGGARAAPYPQAEQGLLGCCPVLRSQEANVSTNYKMKYLVTIDLETYGALAFSH